MNLFKVKICWEVLLWKFVNIDFDIKSGLFFSMYFCFNISENFEWL